MHIVIFSPPFSGHLNVLLYLSELIEKKKHQVSLIITGWEDVNPSTNNCMAIFKKKINSSNPMVFTLNRTLDLTKECLEICSRIKPDLIIYDFFSMEGFIVGSVLHIRTMCSIPAMIGEFDPNNKFFLESVKNNQERFGKIKHEFGIDLQKHNLQQVSDSFLVPAEVNILWSFPEIIESNNYTKNRNLRRDQFVYVGPRKSNLVVQDNRQENQQLILNLRCLFQTSSVTPLNEERKIIYVSFGTVVTNNLMKHQPIVKEFIIDILNWLIIILGNKEYYIILSLDIDEFKDICAWPYNFLFYKNAPQIEIFKMASLFITHCGGNSFNEAIEFSVPMIGIPFFGDQHLIAEKISKHGLGISFSYENPDEHINTEVNDYHRKSLSYASLEKACHDILNNQQKYLKNFELVTRCLDPVDLILKKIDQWPFELNSGDLIYGTNIDRIRLITYLGKEDEYRICKYLPFSVLFADNHDPNKMPCILDIYNDSLFDENIFEAECKCKFPIYANTINEFRKWLGENNQFLKPAGSFSNVDSDNKEETIWNICVGGIEFFTQVKGYKIHFVMDTFQLYVNKATTLEILYIKKNWSRLRNSITFYQLDFPNQKLRKTNEHELLF